MKIKLVTIEDVKRFVKICSSYEEDIDFISGRFVIDAKSILGIFSVDLRKEARVRIHTDNKETEKKFYKQMEEFYEL